MEAKILCVYHELVNPNSLRPHPDNNNIHTDDQIDRLSKIIQKNGWTSPITLSRKKNVITKGHARWQAALKQNYQRVPIQYIDYESDQHEYADLTADNAIASWSQIDRQKTIEKVMELKETDENFDTDILGFESDSFFNEMEQSTQEFHDEMDHQGNEFDNFVEPDIKEKPVKEINQNQVTEEKYFIVLECSGHVERERYFEEFKNRGLKCRLLDDL